MGVQKILELYTAGGMKNHCTNPFIVPWLWLMGSGSCVWAGMVQVSCLPNSDVCFFCTIGS